MDSLWPSDGDSDSDKGAGGAEEVLGGDPLDDASSDDACDEG
jgi:hypothetical protein